MMKYSIAFSVLILTCCNRATEHKNTDRNSLSTQEKVKIIYSLGTENRLGDLLKKCHEQSKIPILYFYADWCDPCRAFGKSLTDDLMKPVFENAMLIGVNINNDTQHLTNFYSVNAVPTFIKIGQDSTVIARITSGEWGDDTATNIAPVMDKFINQIVYNKK